MKKIVPQHRQLFSGFTLIEMLVVIAIISMLAALLLPALTKSKTAVKVKAARMEMTTLIAAINQYESEYKRMPVSSNAMLSLDNANFPDFTCGTVLKGTDLPNGQISAYQVQTANPAGVYQNANSEVMNILRNVNSFPNSNSICNPRKISFISPRITSGTNVPGVGPDGVFRDPWGNPYIVTIDCDYDDKCVDGFYSNLLKNKYPSDPSRKYLPVSTAIWSFGPDGKISGGALDDAENKDNILSWQ